MLPETSRMKTTPLVPSSCGGGTGASTASGATAAVRVRIRLRRWRDWQHWHALGFGDAVADRARS